MDSHENFTFTQLINSSDSAEFDVIRRYFTGKQSKDLYTSLGIGDDGAVVRLPNPQQSMVITADTLVADVHFFREVNPFKLGHKALAVNLSDLAAMAATPRWFTLCLTLETIDEDWLSEFSLGLLSLANEFNIFLLGGDTTRGPLSISIQAVGTLGSNQYLTRSGANEGEDIWVTGTLGEAAWGLALLKQGEPLVKRFGLSQSQKAHLVSRLEKPTPRCAWVNALSKFASAAIDISDGLGQDLMHICQASGVGAKVDLSSIPVSHLAASGEMANSLRAQVLKLALTGGDDYEICFTADGKMRESIISTAAAFNIPVARIGQLDRETGIRWYQSQPSPSYDAIELSEKSFGYEHFNNS